MSIACPPNLGPTSTLNDPIIREIQQSNIYIYIYTQQSLRSTAVIIIHTQNDQTRNLQNPQTQEQILGCAGSSFHVFTWKAKLSKADVVDMRIAHSAHCVN